jgi:hypothetical protein
MDTLVRIDRLAGLVAAGLPLLLSACASTNIQAQWTNPQFANRSLQGATVMVRCDARETAIRQICLDQLSQQLRAAGAVPVAAPEAAGAPADANAANAAALDAARAHSARAVMSARIAPGAAVAAPRPQVGFGVGSWGGNVGTSVGVSVPVGAQRVNTSYTGDLVLTDVETGKVIWTSTISTPASSDVNGQVAQLAKSGVEAAKKAGVL